MSSDARFALLGGLIDHAPLFPPASMALPDALREDRLAQMSDESFMLGRFVCPASQVGELGADGRALSVVLDSHPSPGTGRSEAWGRNVEAVETRVPRDLASLLGLAPEIYVELPVDDMLETRLDELARLGLRAKVRCGGTAALHRAELARFVRACRERALVFKATAGLHHAYATDADHGFLNLLAAAVFGDEDDALSAAPGSFAVTADAFRWNGREAGASEIAHARGTLFHSIGSCSFREPVEQLRALGVLGR